MGSNLIAGQDVRNLRSWSQFHKDEIPADVFSIGVW